MKKIIILIVLVFTVTSSAAADSFNMFGIGYIFQNQSEADIRSRDLQTLGLTTKMFYGEDFGFYMSVLMGSSVFYRTEDSGSVTTGIFPSAFWISGDALSGFAYRVELDSNNSLMMAAGIHLNIMLGYQTLAFYSGLGGEFIWLYKFNDRISYYISGEGAFDFSGINFLTGSADYYLGWTAGVTTGICLTF